MKKLLIVSSSTRMLKEPAEPIPAIERFDGIFARSVRKYAYKVKGIDILILSPVYGLISPEEMIPYHDPIGRDWHKAEFSKNHIAKARKANLERLKKALAKQKYSEVYINVGRRMLQLMEGFEEVFPKSTKITYSIGNGAGPKVADMKKWLEAPLS